MSHQIFHTWALFVQLSSISKRQNNFQAQQENHRSYVKNSSALKIVYGCMPMSSSLKIVSGMSHGSSSSDNTHSLQNLITSAGSLICRVKLETSMPLCERKNSNIYNEKHNRRAMQTLTHFKHVLKHIAIPSSDASISTITHWVIIRHDLIFPLSRIRHRSIHTTWKSWNRIHYSITVY